MMAEEVAVGDSARQKVYQGLSGGMVLHMGYLFGTDKAAPEAQDGRSYSPQGGVAGIGGAMRVNLWRLLRVGFEGYVSTMYNGLMDRQDLLKRGSYVRVGCGGVLADACWRKEKAWPYVGAAVGGGAMNALYIANGSQSDWAREAETYAHKHSFFYVTPYVGCDYCMTEKMHLTFRFDWMLAVNKNELVMPTGPRVYLGFMFVH